MANRSGRSIGIEMRICSWIAPENRYGGRCRHRRSARWLAAVPTSSWPVKLVSTSQCASRYGWAASARSSVASSASSRSSASSQRMCVPVARSMPWLRASENEPFHGKCSTVAPYDSAISIVRSDDPVSTMIISSTPAAHEARQSGSISSSSFTIMQSEMLTLPAAVTERRATSLRKPRIAFTAWRSRGGSVTAIGRFRRALAACRLPARFSRPGSRCSAARSTLTARAASLRPNSATPR